MRQNFLRYLVLGADLERNSINILAEVLALLANLLLFFVVIGCNLVDVFLAIYLFDYFFTVFLHFYFLCSFFIHFIFFIYSLYVFVVLFWFICVLF